MKKLNALLTSLLFSATTAYACPPATADLVGEESMPKQTCMHHAALAVEVDNTAALEDLTAEVEPADLKEMVIIDDSDLYVSPLKAVTAVNHDVKALGMKFSDPYLFINPGDSVSWSNMAGHTSTSKIIPEGAEKWDSPMGESVTVDFTVPGIYVYACAPHISMGMLGTVVVGEVTLEQMEALISENKGMTKRTLKKLRKAFKKR